MGCSLVDRFFSPGVDLGLADVVATTPSTQNTSCEPAACSKKYSNILETQICVEYIVKLVHEISVLVLILKNGLLVNKSKKQ